MYRLTVLPTLLLGLLFLGLSSCIPVTPSAEEQPISGTPTEVISPTLPLLVKIVVPTERNAEVVNAWVAEQPNWAQEVEIVTDLDEGDFADIILVPKEFITATQSSKIETIVGDTFAARYLIGNIPEDVIATIKDDLLPQLSLDGIDTTMSTQEPSTSWILTLCLTPSINESGRRAPCDPPIRLFCKPCGIDSSACACPDWPKVQLDQ